MVDLGSLFVHVCCVVQKGVAQEWGGRGRIVCLAQSLFLILPEKKEGLEHV